MQIIPLDDPKTTGKLVRHEHVLIDGVDVKRHGRHWYVLDHRGIPSKVEFGYLNAAAGIACVYVHRKVSQGRGTPSHPAGYNELVPALAPNCQAASSRCWLWLAFFAPEPTCCCLMRLPRAWPR